MENKRYDNNSFGSEKGGKCVAPRKQYTVPSLVVYGNIEELTEAGGNFHPDGFIGSSLTQAPIRRPSPTPIG